MLIGLNSILSPDLLWNLAAMGHGDDIVIADANFPGESMGERIVRLDGLSATKVLEAVLTIMPLDSFVTDSARTMEMVENAQETPPIVLEFQEIINKVGDSDTKIVPVERFAFYEVAKKAFVVVQTGELRLYGNIILKKGVVKFTNS